MRCENLVAVIERRGHQVGRLVAGKAEHDALIARAFVLVAAGIDALRDFRRLAVQMVFEGQRFPVEAVLRVTDVAHRAAHRFLDLLQRAAAHAPFSITPLQRISPASTTRWVVVSVSQATRASGSLDRNRSTIASEI